MPFLNYFTDSERGFALRANRMKNALFGWLGPLLVRLHVPPDAISYLGVACLIGVVIWFLSHPYRAFFLLVAYVAIDGIDGAYARYLDRPTQSGAFADIVCDQLGMVVIVLGFIQYRMVDGQIGAYYMGAYIVMIAFSVVQNAQGIPMQFTFRSKYFLYGIYALWAFTRINLAPLLIPIFSLVMTFSIVQSYIRLKRGLYWKYDLPEILRKDKDIRAKGGQPPRFWQSLNVLLPAAVIVLLLFMGGFTQIRGMIESPDVKPEWKKNPLDFLQDKERPRSITDYHDGWLLSAHMAETGFSTYYLLDSGFVKQGSFRVPWELHRQHGSCTDGDDLYVADRLSRRVYDINVEESLEQGLAVLERSFDTTLRQPVTCTLTEHEGETRMLVAEYMSLYRTVMVDHEKAFERGSAEDALIGWYRNMGFAHAMTTYGTRVFEMNSSLWKDLIYVIDPERALHHKYLRGGLIKKIAAPKWRCRGIAVKDGTLALVDGKTKAVFTISLEEAGL